MTERSIPYQSADVENVAAILLDAGVFGLQSGPIDDEIRASLLELAERCVSCVNGASETGVGQVALRFQAAMMENDWLCDSTVGHEVGTCLGCITAALTVALEARKT
jgi:hypothetical protein